LLPKIRAVYRRTEEDRKQLGAWLVQCKEACLAAGDDWLAWLERETAIPKRTAQRWMDEANNQGHEHSAMRQMAHGGQDYSPNESPPSSDVSTPLPDDEDDEPEDHISLDVQLNAL